MSKPPVKITVTLDEPHYMMAALETVRAALAEQGVAPR